MLSKIAGAVIGTRIAAESGKAGLLGAVAGMVATRVIARSPVGAAMIGGAYVAHKLWQKKRQIDKVGPHAAAVEDGVAPSTIEPAKSSKAPAAKPVNATGSTA